MTVVEAEFGTGHSGKSANMGPKSGGPILKQPIFDWTATDQYAELRNFRLEANNIFLMHNTKNIDGISIIKKTWLGRQGLQFKEALKQAKQEQQK